MGQQAALAVREHPRHAVLAALVAGLALGGRVPGEVVVLAGALAVAAGARPVGPALAASLAVAAVAGGAWAGQRTEALDHSALYPEHRRAVAGEATLIAAPREDRSGTWTVRARWRGEPVLLRLAESATLGGACTGCGTGDGAACATRSGAACAACPAGAPCAAALEIGAVVRVAGRLRPPDLAARAFHAHATIDAAGVTPTGRRRGGVSGVVDAIRGRAEAALGRGLPAEQSGLLRGMVLGQDAGMSAGLRGDFRAAGLSHLVAASGANIALLAAFGAGAGMLLGLGLRSRWALVLGLIVLYVPLAGAGPSIQRAGVMGAATVIAAAASRPVLRWYALALAAALTLAVDPRTAGDPGWQLSFAAVLGIVTLGPGVRERLIDRGLPSAGAEAVAVTVAATLATAPIIALTFGRTSLVSLPANVLAAPAVAPVMWLGMLAATIGQVVPGLAAPVVALAGLPVGFLTSLARTAAALPAAEVGAPAGAVGAACAVAVVALVRGRGPGRRLAVAALVTAVVVAALLQLGRRPALAAPAPGTLRVLALDVGQGDATLLQAGGHALLVDAGPPDGRVAARLRAVGVRRLDAVLATHGASDHLGGVPAVLRTLEVGLVLDGRDGDASPVPAAVDPAARARGVPVVAVTAGEEVHAGPITLRVLSPQSHATAFSEDEANDRAVVAVASAYGSRVLLTADAESDVLAPLAIGPVDVLKVSHHGSDDEGLAALLTDLRPRVALVEVGAHNTYGHPAAATLRALQAVPDVLRTDRDGTAGVDLGPAGARIVRAGG